MAEVLIVEDDARLSRMLQAALIEAGRDLGLGRFRTFVHVTLPLSRQPILAALLIMPLFMARYGLYVLSMWAVMSIAAIGLNLTLGYAGQISLAQGAFVGIGAYAAGILTTAYGWPLLAVLPLAVALCFAIGWGLGYPALPPLATGAFIIGKRARRPGGTAAADRRTRRRHCPPSGRARGIDPFA